MLPQNMDSPEAAPTVYFPVEHEGKYLGVTRGLTGSARRQGTVDGKMPCKAAVSLIWEDGG